MKHLYLTLGYLKEQRTKLDDSIALLETLLGGNGNGHKGALKMAETALALHEAHPARQAKPSAGSWRARKDRRAAKAQTLIEILREGPTNGMLIRDLAAAAQARGIPTLKGIAGLVKRGTLKRVGKIKAHVRYSLAREA